VDKLIAARRLLVVEDEMLILLMIEDMLADLGYRSVASAATIEKALSLLETQDFDAAMLDVNLSGSGSQPVSDALTARGIPFVFSTGNSISDMREGFRSRPVLKKPFSSDGLASVLGELFATDRDAVDRDAAERTAKSE